MTTPRSIPEISVDSLVVYRRLKELKPGEVIPYSAIEALIHRDPTGEAYGCVATARRKLLNDDKRVIEAVHGVGLKRSEDESIVGCGAAAMSKVKRTVRTGLKKMACADYEALTPEQRLKYNTDTSLLGAIGQFTKGAEAIEEKAKQTGGLVSFRDTLALFQK